MLNLLAVAILCLAMAGCKKTKVNSLTSCQWKFVKIENKATSVITKVSQFFDENYLLNFEENGIVKFSPYCNIAMAKYLVENKNVIKFGYFYPMTEMYCFGLYDCEMILYNNFSKSSTYSPLQKIY
jgi:heat shock protein HslJ